MKRSKALTSKRTENARDKHRGRVRRELELEKRLKREEHSECNEIAETVQCDPSHKHREQSYMQWWPYAIYCTQNAAPFRFAFC